MKAWLLDDLKGIETLRLADVPDPVPLPGQVVLEVHYAGLNPADRYLAERQYPAKPALRISSAGMESGLPSRSGRA